MFNEKYGCIALTLTIMRIYEYNLGFYAALCKEDQGL